MPQDWAVYPADKILFLASLELKAVMAREEGNQLEELAAWREALTLEALRENL